jgi:hypothetical protein
MGARPAAQSGGRGFVHMALEPNGHYSARSTYEALLVGQSAAWGVKEIWKVHEPNKCKMFLWQVMQECVWTSECLQSRGLDNHGPCALCSQEVESLNHLFIGCSYSREIWFKCLRCIGLRQFTLAATDTLLDRWLRLRKRIAKPRRKAFGLLCLPGLLAALA